jgi:hypothetical protein
VNIHFPEDIPARDEVHLHSLLAKHPAWSGKTNFLGRKTTPYREADETWSPAAGGARNPALKNGFRAMVEESLDATAPELFNN